MIGVFGVQDIQIEAHALSGEVLETEENHKWSSGSYMIGRETNQFYLV
jgi:hypothetical protein